MKKVVLPFLATLMVVAIAFVGCEEHKERPADPPRQAIPLEEAQKLANEFIRTRAEIINDSLNITDTRDFQFSLETLKQYIDYVETEGKRLGRENLGIRIHFAAYPERSQYPDPGYATVILVPTASVQGQVKPQGILPVQDDLEVIDSLKALNFGNGGRPPNDLE
ncbi:hypothetical protein [Altibacter sp. HG106]|uniref:hypothetical protein n=1 Tax=Altibacter sp. HG106 TaxID=3023937 RepID=UPI00235089CF|nr:hypothetical protein [Altibacter sp. HG106]MDC7995876.1 hypothetical protein [Altibacter sp. HG106]